MSRPIIEVSGLSKMYRLGEIGTSSFKDEVVSYWRRFRGTERHPEKGEFWALRDVSFAVQPGEVVGIIGRNGAGKSTLLKILSRITEPTAGRATLRGRIASLLEVGTGFHPDLSGRDNIYLNGAILGMTRGEIRGKFDDIVAFADIEEFIDTPVKRYSSGMYVRLAFAVAAHLEPEILIIDEVLAVGDTSFQKKCLGKMQSVAQSEGRTVLFVSHDMAAITTLTQRCLLLQRGTTVAIGDTATVVGRYLEGGVAAGRSLDYVAPLDSGTRPHIHRVFVQPSEKPGVQAAGRPMEIVIELRHPAPVSGACLSFQIVNQFQQPATHLWIFDSDTPYARTRGGTVLRCMLPAVRLNVGRYSLRLYFSEPKGGQMFEQLESVCPFEVVRLGQTNQWGWRPDACVYHEDATWSVQPSD